MQKLYAAFQLTLIGEADEVVLGSACGGDVLAFGAPDFEFEQD
jgi:hypothetical protein